MVMSTELNQAMESDCATGVEEILAARRSEDLAALRALLRADADVPRSSRQNAIHILGRWGDSESAGAVRSLLPTFDKRERINAVAALGQLDSPDAEAAVLDLSGDDSPDVRRFAVYALANLATETALERLRVMQSEDPERFVRAIANRTLRH